MEVNRELLNPFFEGYKLSLDKAKSPSIDIIQAEYSAKDKECNVNNDFQLLAERIYENKLKATKDRLYFMEKSDNIIGISKITGITDKHIKGPFGCFDIVDECILANHLVDGWMIIEKETRTLVPLKITGDLKVLATKASETDIYAIIQSVTKVKDQLNENNETKYEKMKENPAFCFYKVTIPKKDVSRSLCDYIGWSTSRPLVSFLRGWTFDGIIGTSSGIVTDRNQQTEIEENIKSEPIVNEEEHAGFNSEDEDEVDNLNDCRMFEFRSADSSVIQYPEISISGASVNDFEVAVKYLNDVIIYDFDSETLRHISTFPAINYIQKGKMDRVFSVFGKNYAFILESGGNVYCYAKPKRDKTSAQYYEQLDEQILGWAHSVDEDDMETLYILANNNHIFKLTIK